MYFLILSSTFFSFYYLFILAVPHGMWDLSSLTSNKIHTF